MRQIVFDYIRIINSVKNTEDFKKVSNYILLDYNNGEISFTEMSFLFDRIESNDNSFGGAACY